MDNGSSGSACSSLCRLSAASSKRSSALGSRARRTVPFARAVAPANLALTPSSLISLREEAKRPPTSSAPAGKPVTSNAAARRAASATEASTCRSDPGRPSARSVPPALTVMSPSLAARSSRVRSPASVSRTSARRGPANDDRELELLEHRADIRMRDLHGEIGAVQGIEATEATFDIDLQIAHRRLDCGADVAPGGSASRGPSSPLTATGNSFSLPFPAMASRPSEPGPTLSVSISATRCGLPRAR